MIVTEEQAIQAIRDYPLVAVNMKLGKQALDAYLYISSCGEVTTDQLRREFGISVQHANMIFRSLVKKGYVDRYSKPQKSGGYEFAYTKKK